MPQGSADHRAIEQAAIVKTIHSRNIDPRIPEWIGKIRPQNETQEANIRPLRRPIKKPEIPSDLNAAIAHTTAKAHGSGHQRGKTKTQRISALLTEM